MPEIDRLTVWRQREADRKATEDAEWRKRVHNRHPVPTQGLGSPRGEPVRVVVRDEPAEPVDDVEPIDLDEIEEQHNS